MDASPISDAHGQPFLLQDDFGHLCDHSNVPVEDAYMYFPLFDYTAASMTAQSQCHGLDENFLYNHSPCEGNCVLSVSQTDPASLVVPKVAAHESGAFADSQGNGTRSGLEHRSAFALAFDNGRVLHASPYGPLADTLPLMYPDVPNIGHVNPRPLLRGTSAWTSSPQSISRLVQQYYAVPDVLSPSQVTLPFIAVPLPPSTVPATVQHRSESSSSDLCSDQDTSPTPSQARATLRRSIRAASSSPYSASLSASSSARSSPSPHAPQNPCSQPSSRSSSSDSDRLRLKCPQCDCIVGRPQELRRHLKTHAPKGGEPRWPCCGVPLAEAAARGVPPEVAKEVPFAYNGMLFVGGCGEPLSRRDALKRHLKRKGKGEERLCYGDPYGWYLRGNQEKR